MATILTYTKAGIDSVLSAFTAALGTKYNKPSTGIPAFDLASTVQTSLGKADTALQSVNKATLGLGAVDNTSDRDKPVSDLQQVALDTKQNAPTVGVPSPQTFLRGDNSWSTPGPGSIASSQITDATAIGVSLVTAADAATARSAIGAGTSNLVIGTTAGTALSGDTSALPVADATTTSKGSVQLAGDLGGTATAPTVPALAGVARYATADVPAWAPSTAYAGGQRVTQAGYFWTAKAPFTSGTTFTAANWVRMGPTLGTADGSAPLGRSDVTSVLDSTLLAWSYNPEASSATAQTPAAGTLFMARIPVGRSITAATISVVAQQAGVGPGAANCYLGLYDANLNLLGSTADITSTLTTAGLKQVALASPVALAGGAGAYVWGALLIGTQFSSTVVGFTAAGAMTAAVSNFGYGVRAGNGGTGLSALPATVTSQSTATRLLLMGLS